MRHLLIYPATLAAIAAGVGLLADSAPVAAQTIQLSDCTSGWSIVSNTFTCSKDTGSASVAPANCSVSATKTVVAAAGESVTVTGSCLQGSPAPTFSFSGITGNATANQWTGVVAPGQKLTATASNSAGGPVAAGSVTFTAASTGNGGGGTTGGGESCSPLGTILVPVSLTGARTLSANKGSFGNDAIMVGKFTTGTRTGLGRITVYEYASGPVQRTFALSSSACALSGSSVLASLNGTGASFWFSVGPNAWGYPVLQPGTPYYLNAKNEQGGVGTCAAGGCDVGMELRLP